VPCGWLTGGPGPGTPSGRVATAGLAWPELARGGGASRLPRGLGGGADWKAKCGNMRWYPARDAAV